MKFLSIEDMTICYGKLKAVDRLTLHIPRGEVFGFIGPNGAGKTSTIRVLATLIRPQSGRVTFDGIDLLKYPRKVRPRIGFMPDNFGVYEDLTVEEYLHFFAAAYCIAFSKRESLVRDILSLTDLTVKKESPVDTLSRGMKQRLGLARVLIHDPEFLLLDEPTSGLDPRARIEVRELLKELKKMGKTIFISSHILSELAELCTRIGIIEAGKLVAQGPLDEIYRNLDISRTIHIQITNLSSRIKESIQDIQGVQSIEEVLDRLVVKIYEKKLSPEELLKKMIKLGASVRIFQPEAMDLETAFMKLTEGKVT